MENRKQRKGHSDDALEVVSGEQSFELSSTTWLVGQAIRYLHSTEEEAKLAYGWVIELLGSRTDAVETIAQIIQRSPEADVQLRWSLIYLLGDIGDAFAAEFLTRSVAAQLPAEEEEQGCEGPRDRELLVRTMAVEAIYRIATRHAETAEYLLKLVSEHPTQPILIEIVKAAIQLGLKEKVSELLSEEDRWILDIRQVPIEEVIAEPERQDEKERGFTPPKMPADYTTPRVTESPAHHTRRRVER